jgi:lysophospholipase L1-like esterase
MKHPALFLRISDMRNLMIVLLVTVCSFLQVIAHASASFQAVDTIPTTLMALGDSYTIGESVTEIDRYPLQTVALLQKFGFVFTKPVIVAKTGWTTQDLLDAIEKNHFSRTFDRVTLLIGVNDQYQGYDTGYYRIQFEKLLQKAIALAGFDKKHVFVLSIPDYSVTPFGVGLKKIREAIEAFNKINFSVASAYQITYINITDDSRKAADDQSLTAKDGLHPSAKQYAIWSNKLAAAIVKSIEQ